MSRFKPRHPVPVTGPPTQSDYVVGYGKPPKEHRFRKGQSGNPRGRPRGAKSSKDLLEKILSTKLTVHDAGGGPRKIEQLEALLLSMVARAIKGDTRCMNLLLRLMEQTGMISDAPEQPQKIIVRWMGDDD